MHYTVTVKSDMKTLKKSGKVNKLQSLEEQKVSTTRAHKVSGTTGRIVLPYPTFDFDVKLSQADLRLMTKRCQWFFSSLSVL